MAEPIPYIEPFSPAPNRQTDSREQFTIKVDQRMLEENRFTGQANALADFVNARAQGVDDSASAAQQSAAAALQAEQAAGQQVALAADEVAKATQKVEAATEQADRATEQATSAQSYAAAAGAAAGLPALAGKAGMFMQVSPDEQSVRWAEVKPWRIGDVLISARASVEDYLEATGGIYLQSAYPELYAELGLLGGDLGVAWERINYMPDAINSSVPAVFSKTGVGLARSGTTVYRAANPNAAWEAIAGLSMFNASIFGTDGNGKWVAAYMNYVSTPRLCVRTSEDDGLTWSAEKIVASSTYYQQPTYVKFEDDVWFIGGFANQVATVVFKSTDGANSFVQVGIGTSGFPQCRIAETDGLGAWLFASSNRVFMSTNNVSGLVQEITSSLGIGSTQVISGILTDRAGTWVVVGEGFCVVSENDRQSWSYYSGANMPAGGPCVTDGDGSWLAGKVAGDLRLSRNNGRSWDVVGPAASAALCNSIFYVNGSLLVLAYDGAAAVDTKSQLFQSLPSYGYDIATQFRLPNVSAPQGLKSFIKAKEVL